MKSQALSKPKLILHTMGDITSLMLTQFDLIVELEDDQTLEFGNAVQELYRLRNCQVRSLRHAEERQEIAKLTEHQRHVLTASRITINQMWSAAQSIAIQTRKNYIPNMILWESANERLLEERIDNYSNPIKL